jgi:protein-tyrosine phosphatase
MPSVLFICRGNLFRSPIAAAHFSSKLQERQISSDWVVDSAGTWTENNIPIAPLAKEFAAARGLQLDGHVSKMIEDVDIFSFDQIIVMEIGQKEALQIEFNNIDHKTNLLTKFSGVPYDIPDPVGLDEEDGLIILSGVIDLIDHGFNEIVQIAENNT